ncbi:MAG: hypothetical protein M1836_007286 [Candelina mexicana]|nr:MAG: hypothetical protein M1836_007286 [Candelina mexicana]
MSLSHHPDHYRSTPTTPYGVDPRGMTSLNVEEAMQHARMGIEGDYFTGAVSRFPPSIRSRSPYGGSFDQDPYGGGNANAHPELGINDTVRRTNLAVTLANNSIGYKSQYSQVHPKICSDGRYPPDFQLPKTVEEVRVLDGELTIFYTLNNYGHAFHSEDLR